MACAAWAPPHIYNDVYVYPLGIKVIILQQLWTKK